MADWRRAVPVYARCFCRTRSHDGLRRRLRRSGFPGRSCGRDSLRGRTIGSTPFAGTATDAAAFSDEAADSAAFADDAADAATFADAATGSTTGAVTFAGATADATPFEGVVADTGATTATGFPQFMQNLASREASCRISCNTCLSPFAWISLLLAPVL